MVTPYLLRHTCASLMAQHGVPVTTAAAVMWHDPAMFLRFYAHLYSGNTLACTLLVGLGNFELATS